MEELLVWANEKWPQLLAALSIGGGSGFLTKKYKDKKQDKQIALLRERIKVLEGKEIEQINRLGEINTMVGRLDNKMKLNQLEDLNTKETVMHLVRNVEQNKKDNDANFTSITKLITDGQLASQKQLTDIMLKIAK